MGSPGWTRTSDKSVNSRLLCQLSYRGSDAVPILGRAARHIEGDPSGCWLWTGAIQTNGYGSTGIPGSGRTALAHRYVYELLVGPIPEGLTIDHLCRLRHCVNPAHLEPVTMAENLRRARVLIPPKARCKRGHDTTQSGSRDSTGFCRACKNLRQREVYASRAA